MIGLDDIYTRLEIALEAGGIAWWEMELPSGVVFFSDYKATMLGYKPEQFTHYTDFTKIVHPDDYDTAMKAMMDHVNGVLPIYETRYRIKAKDGTYLTFYDRGKIVRRQSKEIKVAGIVVNVTDRRDF